VRYRPVGFQLRVRSAHLVESLIEDDGCSGEKMAIAQRHCSVRFSWPLGSKGGPPVTGEGRMNKTSARKCDVRRES